MDVQKCGICVQEFTEHCERNTITKKDLMTLSQMSRNRGDGKWKNWEQQLSLICHATCHKIYIESNDAGLKRKILDGAEENGDDDDNNNDGSSIQQQQSPFDYASNCIFCGQSCNYENDARKPQVKRKRTVCKVIENTDLRKEIEESIRRCDDKWSQDVKKRILAVADLTAVSAIYHSLCHLKFTERKLLDIKGQPPMSEYTRGWHKIREHIDDSGKGQYTLDDLRVLMECNPSDEYLKTGLAERFGDELIFSNLSNNKTLVTLKTFRDKILYEFFMNNKHPETAKTNHCKVVEKAARIVLKDLCTTGFIDYRTNLLTADSMNTLDDIVPETLKLFLSHIVKNQRNNCEQYKNKATSIAHAILGAARPSSVSSPLQLASSLYVHLKTKSKILVTILSKLGFGVPYPETLRYETMEQDKSKLAKILEDSEKFILANLENAAISAGENAAAICAIGYANSNSNEGAGIKHEKSDAAVRNGENSVVMKIDGKQRSTTTPTKYRPTTKLKENVVRMDESNSSILNGENDASAP